MWTDLEALRYDLLHCENEDDETAIAWPIVGRFKANNGIAGCYMIPIAGLTNSGIPFFKWTQRFVRRLAKEGAFSGWAFRRDYSVEGNAKAKASDYRNSIFTKLEVIQQTTTLIDPRCDVWDDYGVQRSGCRFFTCTILNAVLFC